MRFWKQTISILSVATLVVCAALFLLFSVSATGLKALAVPTGSMRPNIVPGSLVLVHKVAPRELHVGDVITYTSPTNGRVTISHRIIKTYMIDGRIPGFITKGDANQAADQPIAAGSVVGKVIWHAPHLGNVLLGSKSWWSIAALVYLPAAILLFDEVRKLALYYKQTIPYKLYELRHQEPQSPHSFKYAAGGVALALVVAAGIAVGPAASALLQSNTVTLTNNRISLAPQPTPPPTTGSCTNNTNITVNNSSNQTATSGNTSVSGNTNGGSATSGSASNTNNSVTTITTSGC